MPKPTNFIQQLDRDETDRLEAFCREKVRTVEAVFDYLCAELGFVDSKEFPDHPRRLNPVSVWRWKRTFEATDRIKSAAEVARCAMEASESSGAVAVGEAATRTLSTLIYESLLRMQNQEDVKPAEVLNLANALKSAMGTKKQIDELKAKGRAQFDQLKAAAGRRQLTQQDIDDARRAVFG